MCLGKWSDHNQATGGYYKCNKFDEIKDTDEFKTSNKASEDAKFELNRYIFFFTRYENHAKSEKMIKALKSVIMNKIKLLHDIKHYPLSELDFLGTAADEIASCRQVLKYTYVFGYMKKNMSPVHKGLFEH